MTSRPQHTARSPARGFSLVEATASVVLVSILLVAALTAAGTSARLRQETARREFAAALASQLAEEIAAMSYGSTSSGTLRDAGPPGSRATFASIDDYNGLAEAPPLDRAGAAISAADDWARTTTVERVLDTDPSTATTTETGVKRIRIDVSNGKTVYYSMIFLRTARWESMRN